MASNIQTIVKNTIGISLPLAVSGVIALGVAGAALGTAFPKFEASALLQLPERLLGDSSRTSQVIELPTYKRVAASYESAAQLRSYLASRDVLESAAGVRLLKQAESSKFWAAVAEPVLPFSKQDAKRFGDLKDAASNTVLGIDITAEAPNPQIAEEMVSLMADYYANALSREQMRSWILTGKADATGSEDLLRADIVKAELDISLAERRIQDMKGVLARHPETVGLTARPAVSVDLGADRSTDRSDRSDRFLPPMAQIVGAESVISYRREQIRRFERELQQKSILAAYFSEASTMVDQMVDAQKLNVALHGLVQKSFHGVDKSEEWAKEAVLRVDGALASFAAARGQIGVRNGVRVAAVSSRDPLRLGLFGVLAGLGLLGAAAFARLGLRSLREEHASQGATH